MKIRCSFSLLALVLALVCACNGNAAHSAASAPTSQPSASGSGQAVQESALSIPPGAPPASETAGFDGAKAYAQVAKLVSFGPRPPASDAIHRAQDYIRSQLEGFGCPVTADDFTAQTPGGAVPMKNIIAKIPGTGQGIILLLTHYDTLRLDNFVGAEDGGSSTGLMLEMARVLCGVKPQTQANAVWIAFLDGEEAQVVENGQPVWKTDLSDDVYGSRELAAQMAVSGDLKRVRAAILADMIGQYDLRIERDTNSTASLTDRVWKVASRLGYSKNFVSQETTIDDDHLPFVNRRVPSVDIIDLNSYAYWHTTQDTLDKISPKSLAIVGHVILETIAELQKP